MDLLCVHELSVSPARKMFEFLGVGSAMDLRQRGPFGRAITDAVEVAELMANWPQGLAALVAPHPRNANKFAWAVERRSQPTFFSRHTLHDTEQPEPVPRL